MPGLVTIKGPVNGENSLIYGERTVKCWTNAMQAAIAPQPLDLAKYKGSVVSVSGRLHGDLWEASFNETVEEEGFQEIEGTVVGFNIIEASRGRIRCYRHGIVEAWFSPLNLSDYMGLTITVTGKLRGNTLYRANVVRVPDRTPGGDHEKEARSLNDLLRIRAANRQKIEAVNRNLGTALGHKWTNGQNTHRPSIIIFVPLKLPRTLVPNAEKVPDTLEDPATGVWCLTDVVTGGKASPDELDPQPELSEENQRVIQELRSGRIGLIGGIQLAVFEGGPIGRAIFGTAGIAVRHRGNGALGLLTNQHVADVPGRQIYHPRHFVVPVGVTHSTREFSPDEAWYQGVIDERRSWVRCDCGFVEVDQELSDLVQSGLHAIGNTGALLRIDQDAFDIIGQRVISVGRTRGVQRGTVVAYAYEFNDGFFSDYTDLLIIGEDGNAFSDHGDSGKIIVTDDEHHRPVGLLWGGWQERLRHDRQQENWTYAIDLGKVLDLLNLDLL